MLLGPSYSRARFGPFELNLRTRELRNGDRTVLLPEQPFKLLVLLLHNGEDGAEREEIRNVLWSSNTYVDWDHGINVAVGTLRTAMRDSTSKPKYIATLARVGYKILQPVEWVPIPAPATTQEKVSESAAPPSEVASLPAPDDGPPIALVPTPIRDVPAAGKRRLWTVAMSAIVLAAVGIVTVRVFSRSHNPNALREKDAVVLADFVNSTKDPVFDDTLETALSIALRQSPFINVLPENKVAATLELMTLPKTTVLTPEVSSEVCKRANAKAYIAGSIVSLGKRYVLTLMAVNCQTSDLLGEEQVTAESKEEVLSSLDQAASRLRGQLGESLGSVQKYAAPLAEATTPSLDALKAYSLGRKLDATKGGTAALPLYERAVELDPNFAMAYRAIAVAYSNVNEVGRAAENARKAYDLRGKVSERERFSIEAGYYGDAVGDMERAAQAYELWQQTYRQDAVPYINLSFIYGNLGNFEGAMQAARKALLLDPNDVASYGDLAISYVSLNRLDEAEEVYKQAEEHKVEGEFLLEGRYLSAFLRGDTRQMTEMVAGAMGKRGTEDLLLARQADTEAWYGKYRVARELTGRASDAARYNNANETAAIYQTAAALREVEAGYPTQARAYADAARKLAPTDREAKAVAALILARTGHPATSEKLAAELDKTLPLDTLAQRYWLPTIRAALALDRNDPSQAVDQLKMPGDIELSSIGNLEPAYLRGEAYLMLRDGNAAAAEFQKFIDHYGAVGNFPLGALARLGLARAYALDAARDPAQRAKARTAYQNFLTLWKDADPDNPVYRQAKAESAKLQH
jgi:eukaryotic-like serine/threonine-protein kinase